MVLRLIFLFIIDSKFLPASTLTNCMAAKSLKPLTDVVFSKKVFLKTGNNPDIFGNHITTKMVVHCVIVTQSNDYFVFTKFCLNSFEAIKEKNCDFMKKNEAIEGLIQAGSKWFMPSLSVDCVILGFHENQLKVLLLKHRHLDLWGIPGGFVYKEEAADTAAVRVLTERTGLSDIFLKQFHTFGDTDRYDPEFHRSDLLRDGIDLEKEHWILQRFVTIGYYALVEFFKVNPVADRLSEKCSWWDIYDLPDLMLDHHKILNKALETLRTQLDYQPVGYNLLPDKFTMPELQRLYETILNKKLDRRNFQRKILGFRFVKRLEETKKGGAHKAPYLYAFDEEKYFEALKVGLYGGW